MSYLFPHLSPCTFRKYFVLILEPNIALDGLVGSVDLNGVTIQNQDGAKSGKR